MAKRRKRTTKPIPLTIGHDPTLWRYASLQEALAANCDSIAQLIQAGKRLQLEQNAPQLTDSTDGIASAGD